MNNVCVVSDVSPNYAPEGKALVSVSVLGGKQNGELIDQIRYELIYWFGPRVNEWQHLRSYTIRKALPEQRPTSSAFEGRYRTHERIRICGDCLSTASIESTIRSGISCAEALLERRQSESTGFSSTLVEQQLEVPGNDN